MTHGIVLSVCDRTGNMVQPWAAAGFECFCVDVRHGQDDQPSGSRRLAENRRGVALLGLISDEALGNRLLKGFDRP